VILPTNDQIAHEQRTFFMKVYLWMGTALLVSAMTAAWVATTPRIANAILGNKLAFDGLLIIELLLVLLLAATMQKLTAGAAVVLFLVYSFTTGLTLSVIFFVYAMSSIVVVFGVTAVVFVGMVLFGFYTAHDLTSWGHVLLFGLLGLVLASFVNLFLSNGLLDWITSIVGVVIFTGLIAYDTQKLKTLDPPGTVEGSQVENKLAIYGALDLYLDFVNLFLRLLGIFGKKR